MSVLPVLKTIAKRITPTRLLQSIPNRWRTTANVALRDLTSHDPVLIYQMGKVGSTTLYETLRRTSVPNPVFHVHYLVVEHIRNREALYRRSGMLDTSKARHLAVGRGLSWRIRWSRNVRWIVITGVRDPVRRAISQVMQAACWHYPAVCQDGQIQTDLVLDYLDRELHPKSELIRWGCRWFDTELNPTFAFDALDHPFDRERGYEIILDRGNTILIYRLDRLDAVLRDAIPRLLALDRRLQVTHANRSIDKTYREVYDEVLNRFRMDEARCRRLYDTAYMDHFYGPDLVEGLVERWSQ